jgi:hypothetical protein
MTSSSAVAIEHPIAEVDDNLSDYDSDLDFE